MAHDVFISYAIEDKRTADAVCATLEARGIRCWIAPRDVLPGEDYAEAIVEAIIQAIIQGRVMVLIFSSHSNHSPHVRREVERAVVRGIPVLPFRIEDVSPSPSLEYFIGTAHWLDALTSRLTKHVDRLAESVRLLLSKTAKPAQVAAEGETPGPAPAAEAVVDKGPHVTSAERRPVVVSSRGTGLARVALRLRAVAFGLDCLFGGVLAVTLAVILQIVVNAVAGESEETRAVDVPTLLVLFLTVPCYQWIGNSLGRSLGKLVFRLAVLRSFPRENRTLSAQEVKLRRPGWKLGLLRTLVSGVSLLALGLGYLWAFWDKEGRTWHDIAAGTLVIQLGRIVDRGEPPNGCC
jgi:uncharacterized RDD family membrane protein YckC